MENPHILVIPYPAQGHVIPLMDLSSCLLKHGFKITFVTLEFNHQNAMDILALRGEEMGNRVHLVSVPDGLGSSEERNQPGKISEAILQTMPRKVEELIEEINGSERKINCVIADQSLGWALEIAKKHGIKRAAFCPAAAALLVLGFSIPKLIDDGVIDQDGTPLKREMIKLSPNMPPMNTMNFVWACIGNINAQKNIFKLMVRNNESIKLTDWLLCNSTYELEPAAFTMAPNIKPIVSQPSTPPNSKNSHLGSNSQADPFLWVVRSDIPNGRNSAYPEGFQERIGSRGQMVDWVHQKKVLSHPSIACFISHCGWNSTMEGLSNGVPFLCWPYFADQFFNQSYICEYWGVGLGFERDGRGIITRNEIRNKVEQLVGNEKYKSKSMTLKETVMNSIAETGGSNNNLKDFVKWLNE
ncbi:hypothetical protein GOBAR_DD06245 [Gossypium barbadense]|nr:hypothetical protein GOBAR_DD06245 [Gossypium barbadense]